MRSAFHAFALLTLLIASTTAHADPLKPAEVPEPLRSWTGWVMRGHEAETCPFLSGNGETRCAWPSRLDLKLDAKGGTFSQTWTVYKEARVELPGDGQYWPVGVKSDGKPAAVTAVDELPQLTLQPGTHTVTGEFAWPAQPDSLPVPSGVGLVTLQLNGKPVAFPVRDEEGRVWLQKAETEGPTADYLDIRAYRLVSDDIPLRVTTRLDLNVAGKGREIVLAGPLLPGFIPMDVSSGVPARIEKDGTLKVQIRPGNWQVTVTARHGGGVTNELKLPEAKPPWPAEELWAFEARSDLRLANVEGLASIDPTQTTLPPEWRHLPAYRLAPGDTMKLTEIRRGDSDPAPDQIGLTRRIWLDFDGGGYTFRDILNGTVKRSSRLEIAPPFELGRAAVNGEDQVVSRRSGSPNAGVEIRQGQVYLEADSRFAGRPVSLPAVGWDHDVSNLSATLELPPGFRLLHAGGADKVSNSWIERWSLLDFFGVLVTALAFLKLWGRRWGALAFAAFTITFTEADAPVWIWIVIAGAEALHRALPDNGFRKLVAAARVGALAALLMISLPFFVRQLRSAMYPSLRKTEDVPSFPGLAGMRAPEQTMGSPAAAPASPPASQAAGAGAGAPAENYAADEAVPRAEGRVFKRGKFQTELKQELAGTLGASGGIAGIVASKAKSSAVVYEPAQRTPQRLPQYDPKASINTGPGLPNWNWTTIQLGWNGPVTKAQDLRLYILPPWINFILACTRVTLISMLLFCILGGRDGLDRLRSAASSSGTNGPAAAAHAAAALLLLVLLAAGPVRAADSPSGFPPDELLNSLREKLLEPWDCNPECAVVSRMQIDVSGDTLRIRLEASSAAPSAVALPGGQSQWSPDRVLLDGGASAPLLRTDDGVLWVQLQPGAHQIQIEGRLPAREQVQLPLPSPPRHTDVRAQGWTVDGVNEDGTSSSNLQLTREHTQKTGKDTAGFDGSQLPPFLLIERTLELGLDWRVSNRASRATPGGSAVIVEVPLLAGEQVTTPGITVKNGKVIVSLGPQTPEVVWESTLPMTDKLTLTAPDGVSWTESWRLNASPIWHVEMTGIPAIHHHDPSGMWIPEWRPWPGEKVELEITRPEGVSGQTFTIDNSSAVLKPGDRSADGSLAFTYRSSRGGQHTVALPDGSELLSVAIDGMIQPLRPDGRNLQIPVTPGTHSVKLDWRAPSGIGTSYTTAAPDPGAGSVNHSLKVQVPENRWILFLTGPRLGPAVLFWSLLLVMALVSAALGLVSFVPVKHYQWFLLGIGLTQTPMVVAAIVPVWLVLLGWRRDNGKEIARNWAFNGLQVLIVLMTLAAFGVLFGSIEQGLLGPPEMHITGNGSAGWDLNWFADRSLSALPSATIVSLPMWVYRVAMLGWALWLALSLIGWLKWGWESFSADALWRKAAPKPETPAGTPGETPPAAPKKDYLS